MKANFNLVKRVNPANRDEQLWYAAPATKGSLDADETAALAVADTTLSKGEYKHVMEVSSEKLTPAILRGISVTIGSLGKLRLSFGSKGVADIDDFDAQTMIKNAKFIFTPSKELKAALASATFEAEGVVEDGIKYGTVASYRKAKGIATPGGGESSSGTGGSTDTVVLYLLRQEPETVESFAHALTTLKREAKFCKVCHNISDTETCRICSNPQRDASTVCVVENIRDVMAVEATQQYRGVYHVLGGVISPIDGIGPGDLQIDSLVERVKAGGIGEVILALSTTMEGDTTNFYIYRKLEPLGVKLSVIARGIAVGDELEYADEVTLGRSIVNRTPFSGTI